MLHKLEVQSGLPMGFVANLQMAPKDRILGMSSDNTQAWIVGEDGNLKVIQTGLRSSGSGGGKIGSAEYNADLNAKTVQLFDKKKNTYGDVNPTTWNQIKNAYISDGGSAENFIKNFGNYADTNR